MKYQEFKDNIKNYICSHLDHGQTVKIQPVIKNNGLTYDGLIIMDPLVNVSPTIYLNPYYHRYLNGVPLEDIYDDILTTYHTFLPKQDFDISVFTDFNKARKKIVIKLVNYKRNEELLQQIPHVRYLDLAIVYVCIVTDIMNEYATILIHNSHLTHWQVTPEELYEIAMENSPQLLPSQYEDMEQVISQLTDTPLSLFPQMKVYILSNTLKIHGAAALVYPGVLEAMSNEYHSDLIIIPSSIHETLVIPVQTPETLDNIRHFQDIITEVNETQLTDDEILGDHAYIYDRNSGNISF